MVIIPILSCFLLLLCLAILLVSSVQHTILEPESKRFTVDGRLVATYFTARLIYSANLSNPLCYSQDSGKGCKYPGYDEFNPTSWGSQCAPTKEDWIAVSSGVCSKPGKYGNVFWNCADIELTGDFTAPDSTSYDEGQKTKLGLQNRT